MRSWTDRWPGRLEYEIEEFTRRGLDFQLDPTLLEKQGRVVLRGTIQRNGEAIELEVRYPDLFPFLRPEVFAKELKLERHQNPYLGNLCLLDHSSRDWDTDFSAAWLVAERVPYLLDLLEADEEIMRAAESPQGEPISSYFRSMAGSAIFIPEEALHIDPEALVGSGRISFPVEQPPQQMVRGLLSELVEKKRKKTRTLAKANDQIRSNFSGAVFSMRWARLEKAPEENTPESIREAIDAVESGFGSPQWEGVPGGQVGICGAVFKEEVTQGVYEDTWVFAIRVRRDDGGQGEYLIKGERLSRNDLEARLPSTVRLEDKTVSLLGLGAIGSSLGFEMAKAGLGHLRGCDFDAVEAGTTVRWARGLTAVGNHKTDYMRRAIELDYPFTQFEPFLNQLGASAYVFTAREESELDSVERFLADTDLVIEASAEIGLQQLISHEADAKQIPQLYVTATEGARGGIVASIRPGSGCWFCLQLGLADGTVPPPAADPSEHLQPRGCASPTYRGAGYDLLPVVAQAARAATAILSGRTEDRSRVSVCSFTDDGVSPPVWETAELNPHPECPNCSVSFR